MEQIWLIFEHKSRATWKITSWSYLSSGHSVGLSGPGLPVGEHAGIVPLDGGLQHLGAEILEYLQNKSGLQVLQRK